MGLSSNLGEGVFSRRQVIQNTGTVSQMIVLIGQIDLRTNDRHA